MNKELKELILNSVKINFDNKGNFAYMDLFESSDLESELKGWFYGDVLTEGIKFYRGFDEKYYKKGMPVRITWDIRGAEIQYGLVSHVKPDVIDVLYNVVGARTVSYKIEDVLKGEVKIELLK